MVCFHAHFIYNLPSFLEGFTINTIAVILAGGQGNRLKPLISDIPKPLASINGTPFLFLLLQKIAAEGIKQVVLLTGYLHEKIVAACGDGSQFGLEIKYSREEKPLGTGGAIKMAESYLNNADDFILLNGDTYPDFSLQPFLKQKLNTIATIGVSYFNEDISRYGTVEFSQQTKQIIAFHEKKNQHGGYVNTGVFRFQTKLLEYIPKNSFCSLEQGILPVLLKQNISLHATICDGKFYDIGLPESYLAFCEFWKN